MFVIYTVTIDKFHYMKRLPITIELFSITSSNELHKKMIHLTHSTLYS